MIIFGVILLIAGLLLGIPLLVTVGVIVLLMGTMLWAAGTAGHAVGGRRRYY